MFLNNPAMYLFIILIFPSGKKTDTDKIIPESQNLISEPYHELVILPADMKSLPYPVPVIVTGYNPTGSGDCGGKAGRGSNLALIGGFNSCRSGVFYPFCTRVLHTIIIIKSGRSDIFSVGDNPHTRYPVSKISLIREKATPLFQEYFILGVIWNIRG